MTERRGWPAGPRVRALAAVLGLAAAAPALALDIDPATFKVSRRIEGTCATCWIDVPPPCGGATVYVGDMVRVSVDLLNTLGTLGGLYADDRTTCPPPFDAGSGGPLP